MYSSYSVAAAVCSCVFPVLAIIAVGYRLRARLVQKMKLGMDDWLILVALMFAFSYCCLVLNGSFNASIGQDLSTITPEEYTSYQKHLYFGVIIAHLSYGFVKLAVLQFYKRIFSIEKFILAANVVIAFVVLFMVAATITQIFSAWPISNWWTLGETYIINYGAFITSFAAIDLLLDIVILCLPLPVIRNLHVERSRKFLLVGVFWMGFFCVVATAVRLYYGYKLSEAGAGRPVTDNEFSYISVSNVIWAEIESCCSVIAGCLPTYGPLMRHIALPEFVTSTLQSLLDSVRRKSTNRSAGTDIDPKNAWYPLSENSNNNFTTTTNIQEGSRRELGLAKGDGIHVERSFMTDVQRSSVTQVGR